MIPVTFASEIQEGSDTLRIERIPLNKDGGTFYYELSCNGYADSGRIAVEYGNPAEIVADDTNLAELLEKYAPYIANEARYIPSTWTGFEEAYQAVESLAAEENVTGAQVDEARDNLLDNFAKLRSIADTQRMEEYFAEVGNFTYEDVYKRQAESRGGSPPGARAHGTPAHPFRPGRVMRPITGEGEPSQRGIYGRGNPGDRPGRSPDVRQGAGIPVGIKKKTVHDRIFHKKGERPPRFNQAGRLFHFIKINLGYAHPV